MKIASIIGARPEFVKEAPLFRRLAGKNEEFIIHTGQHYDYLMSKVFFDELGIPEPKYNLEVGSGLHGKQTADMLEKTEQALLIEKPDIVVVSGDTNTTLAGALAAKKLGIRLAHIESGMRSFDKTMPEEINRIITDHISDVLFCSTVAAAKNLKKEGITKNVFMVGDIMVDSIMENMPLAENKSRILEKLELSKKQYLLATVHRASNTEEKSNLKSIIDAFLDSKEKIIFPVHPRTRKKLEEFGLINNLEESNAALIDPVSYLDMLVLEKNARKILTDSGGMQKEAYYFKVPCITLRDSTEWVETVKDKWNILVGADKKKIIHAISNFNPKGRQKEDYGKGNAGRRIAQIISRNLV
jgi:UDP-N-acetylglucosamine 2-epimerase